MDYPGVMGVPITFIDKYNPDQFELLGMTSGRQEFSKKAWPAKRYINAIQHKPNGKEVNGININTSAALSVDDPKGHTFYTADNLEGKVVMLYTRLLIRNKKVKKVSVNTNFFCLTNEKTDIGLIEVCTNIYVLGFQH